MTARRSDAYEQRLIDHEVRRGRTNEAGALFTAGRESRQQLRGGAAEREWYRRELIAILADARSEAELHGLGLSDEVVREARLGDTLLEAWARFGPPRHRPPPTSPPPHALRRHGATVGVR